MLIWMCALHCEAKPVIDRYRLQKSSLKNQFDLYQNNDTACVVSGIGGFNMAQATTWAASHFASLTHRHWINLGIAGHKSLAVGTTLLASKVTSSNNPSVFTPGKPVQHNLQLHEVISYLTEQKNYPEFSACDMEAFEFIQSVSRVDPIKHCCCIKVISDNVSEPAHRNKASISALIESNMTTISEYADQFYRSSELTNE